MSHQKTSNSPVQELKFILLPLSINSTQQLMLVDSQPQQGAHHQFDLFKWLLQDDNTPNMDQENLDNSDTQSVKHSFDAETAENKNNKKQKQPKVKTGCNCKKSFCLKSYCSCFSEDGYCGQGCNCFNCKNNPAHEEIVQVAKNKKIVKFNKGTPHCKCKNSQCQKKYCQCFNAGVLCGVECGCSGCKNCQNTSEGSKNQTAQIEPTFISKEKHK